MGPKSQVSGVLLLTPCNSIGLCDELSVCPGVLVGVVDGCCCCCCCCMSRVSVSGLSLYPSHRVHRYRRVRGVCEPQQQQQQHQQVRLDVSRSTCRYLCDEERDRPCIGFTYRQSPQPHRLVDSASQPVPLPRCLLISTVCQLVRSQWTDRRAATYVKGPLITGSSS